jgi:hypothetical protein
MIWLVFSATACGQGASSSPDAGTSAAGRPSLAADGDAAVVEPASGGRTSQGNAGAAALDAGQPARPGDESDASVDAAPAPSVCLQFSEPVAVGSIELPELDQLSGLVASRSQDGVLFAHEDSTGAPLLYALDTTGRSLAVFTLSGAPNNDWEDIALGSGPDGPLLFIADIGDNAVRTNGTPRGELQVIRLPEPSVALDGSTGAQTLSELEVLRFSYPDGAFDAETLLVHPITGELVIVTRSAGGDSRIFRAPGSTPPDTPTPLEEIGRLAFDPSGQGANATAGDISPSGDRILVRTYTRVYVWPTAPGMPLDAVFGLTPVTLDWAVEPQGEGITFASDGRAWLAAGEQEPTIYRAEANCP